MTDKQAAMALIEFEDGVTLEGAEKILGHMYNFCEDNIDGIKAAHVTADRLHTASSKLFKTLDGSLHPEDERARLENREQCFTCGQDEWHDLLDAMNLEQRHYRMKRPNSLVVVYKDSPPEEWHDGRCLQQFNPITYEHRWTWSGWIIFLSWEHDISTNMQHHCPEARR